MGGRLAFVLLLAAGLSLSCSLGARARGTGDPRAHSIYQAVLAFGDSTAARHLGADVVGPTPRLALSPDVVRSGEWIEASDTTVAAHDQRWLDSLKASARIAAVCQPAQRLWECGIKEQRMAAAVSSLNWEGPNRASADLFLSHPQKPGMRGAFHVVWRLHLVRSEETWRVVDGTIMSIT